MPFCETRPGAPAAQYSSSKTSHSHDVDAPRPPYSSGQDTTDQRSARSTRLPLPVGGEALRGLQGGQGAGGHVGGQPGPGLGPEGLHLRRLGQEQAPEPNQG